MTTATTTRIIATEDHTYSILADSGIIVLTGKHDYREDRGASILRNENGITISAHDTMDHATVCMSRDEARLFAQAILDATA